MKNGAPPISLGGLGDSTIDYGAATSVRASSVEAAFIRHFSRSPTRLPSSVDDGGGEPITPIFF